MESRNFGVGKVVGLILTFPFVLFMFFTFLYVPVNLYQSSGKLLKSHEVNPWEEVLGDTWDSNSTQHEDSKPSYGLINIAKSSFVTSLKSMLIVLLPALVFSFVLLYMTPSWVRSVMMMFRNFLYLMPTILLAYLGYYYILPLITKHASDISWASNSVILSLFVFPYTVIAFTYGLEKIWPSINETNPTFSGRVIHKNMSSGKVLSLVVIVLLVALLTLTKVFGESVIFMLISKISGVSPQANISSSLMNSIDLSDTGVILNNPLSLSMLLFIAMCLFLLTLGSNIISNMGLAIIGSIHNREARLLNTKFSKVPLLSSIPKILLSLCAIGGIGAIAYFIAINMPHWSSVTTLSESFPSLTKQIETFDITAPSVLYFSFRFVWFSLIIGVPVGLFLGYIVKGSSMEHIILAIVRIFDHVPVITIGLFGFSFFVLGGRVDSINILSAGLTTALFLAPKVAILTYEIVSGRETAFYTVKKERPYITSGAYVFSGLMKIIGTGIQMYGLVFGVVITVLYTGSSLFSDGSATSITIPLISYAQQMFTLMMSKAHNLEDIKPLLDNYYIKIMWHYAIFFLVGGGLKFIMSLVDSIRLRDFHKKP